MPRSINLPLPVSTSEWMPSEIMAELPVNAAATNLVQAIAILPRIAADDGDSGFCGSVVGHRGLTFYCFREVMPIPSLLFHKRDPRAELPADAIVKAAEVIAGQVVLKVARIEVIREIEDLQTEFHSDSCLNLAG